MSSRPKSSYDPVAAMYHELWADWYLPRALPALEKLLFENVPAGDKVLDLCCGSGHVTRELAARQYRVTGVDNSAELIALARKALPTVSFYVQDVRRLKLREKFKAVLSTFDSLNHILNLDDLTQVFRNVHGVLEPAGRFVFDMNLEEAYALDLHEWTVEVKESAIGLVRGHFDREKKRAKTELIWFTRGDHKDCWQRRHSDVQQQCYPQGEIIAALREAGFRSIEAMSAHAAGMDSGLQLGRAFFVACV